MPMASASRQDGRRGPAVGLGRVGGAPRGAATTFRVEDGQPFQRIGPAQVGLPLKRGDLTATDDGEATFANLMRHEAQTAFNLEAGSPPAA